jgi:hypothetical protein
LPSVDRLTSGVVLFAVVGTAVALNLTVMGLGATPSGQGAALPTSPASTQPLVQQVVVDVPVLDVPNGAEDNDGDSTRTMASAVPATIGSSSPAAAPATAPPPTAPPVTSAATNVPPTTAGPTTAAPTTAAPTTAAPTTRAGATEYLAYRFDGVGEIIIADHDGRALEFWSVTPEPGWAYQVETNSADKVKIEFRRTSGGEGEAEFVVKRENGKLEVKKER